MPSSQQMDKPSRISHNNSMIIRQTNIMFINKKSNNIEGILHKYSPSMFKGWQKRYVILKDRKLIYKKNKDQVFPNGVLNFDHFQVNVFTNNDKAKS